MKKGLLLALLHCLLALTIAGKFAYDRQTLPRVWVRTVPYDPELPLRGRYVRMYLEVDKPGNVRLSVERDRLTATPTLTDDGLTTIQIRGQRALAQPVAFFIPQETPDPSVLAPGEELWVEVSVPRNGLPRPIRLAVDRAGVRTPIPGSY